MTRFVKLGQRHSVNCVTLKQPGRCCSAATLKGIADKFITVVIRTDYFVKVS